MSALRRRGPREVVRRLPAIVLCLIVGLLVWERAGILRSFSFRYTDRDQVVYWLAAQETVEGRVREPRFYGQPYHHYLDAVVAAPLLGLGVSPRFALPVVATTISVLPFWLLVICAWRRRLLFSALAAAGLPLLLPLSYAFIVSMPRGFATGILFSTIAACLALAPLAARTSFAFGFLLLFSVSLVPSTVLLALPVGVYGLVRNLRDRRLYVWGGLGVAAALALHLMAALFYKLRPERVVFPDAGYLAFSWSNLGERLSSVGDFWSPVLPETPLGPWLAILALALALLASLGWRQPAAGLAVLMGSLGLVLSLGFAHIGVGSHSVFYPFARMYLPLPLFLLLAGLWLELARPMQLSARTRAAIAVVVSVVLLVPFAFRRGQLEEEVLEQVSVRSRHGVRGHSVTELESACEEIGRILAAEGTDLIAFFGRSANVVLAYGCEALGNAGYRTVSLIGVGDRRTWRLEELAAGGPSRVALFGIARRPYEAGLSLGATFGPPHRVWGTRMRVMQLPDGAALLPFLDAMGFEGAGTIARRSALAAGRSRDRG